MIIDVHAHLGWDTVFDEDFTKHELLEKHKLHGIGKTIVQPASCHDLDSVRKQHDAIAQLCSDHPGQFYGMANPDPHLPDDVYEAELRRCVQQLGFVGVKIHTFAHAVHPGGKAGQKVCRLARALGIPVMVHTGPGIPFANPANLIGAARAFPDVPFVIAHGGLMISASEVPLALELCPNLSVDLTWTGSFLIKSWIERFGSERFLFGTDHADNAATELAKIGDCALSESQRASVLYKNALRIYSKIKEA